MSDIHYAEAPLRRSLPETGVCGTPVLASQQWTSVTEHVTCVVCCVHMLALFQRESAVLLATIIGRVDMAKRELEEMRRSRDEAQGVIDKARAKLGVPT